MTAQERNAQRAAAEAEAAALKEWKKNPTGERPATPTLDKMNESTATNRRSNRSTTRTPREKRDVTVRFFHDGRPMPDSQNKFSSLAWFFTKGVDGDSERVSTEALRSLVVKANEGLDGANVEQAEWSITLSNGITLRAVTKGAKADRLVDKFESEQADRRSKRAAAKRTAKSTTKKATAAKKAATKRSTPAKRASTTAKRSTAKRPAAKKAAASKSA